MNRIWAVIVVLLGAVCMMTGCGKESVNTEVADEDVPVIEGYTIAWHDEFNGTELDKSKWMYEAHDPGYTNNELQEYTVSTDNIFVKDGCLNLKALKSVDDDGKVSYTSGKVTTKYKYDFTYGKVVVSAKVPAGQGLWPAIWMMPKSDVTYGQWPVGGEIDIMENLGQDTSKVYSTIHYGLPHTYTGENYTVPEGTKDFSEDFHEFSVEWEEGELRFYVDDNLVYKENKWFSGSLGGVPYDYPAPFDEPFYIILNLAVGGDWPGSPNEATDFENADFLIDYVRVYQK